MDQSTPRKSAIKVLAPVLFILLFVLGTLFVVKSFIEDKPRPPGAVEVKQGAVLPDFTLFDLASKPTPFSQLSGKVFLINFWASWCEACMVEMPSIVELRKAYADKGFAVVLVNVDERPESILPGISKKFGIDFPGYVDKDQKLSELFDVHGIPFSVIIDRNRKILMVETGERNWNGPDIRDRVERWLSE